MLWHQNRLIVYPVPCWLGLKRNWQIRGCLLSVLSRLAFSTWIHWYDGIDLRGMYLFRWLVPDFHWWQRQGVCQRWFPDWNLPAVFYALAGREVIVFVLHNSDFLSHRERWYLRWLQQMLLSYRSVRRWTNLWHDRKIQRRPTLWEWNRNLLR